MAAKLAPLEGAWFSEVNPIWPGNAFSLKIKEVICQEKSKYQDILIFESETFGRVLVLDGVIQCTARDEFCYQEMIAHLPLFSHPCPKSVLVVGGGDGGVLREVAKHPMVQEIHLCEIDERVIDLSKKHLPYMAVGFDNPKVKVHVQDGLEYISEHKGTFDVIITDSTDPEGLAEVLYQRMYFNKVKDALKPDGIMCLQGEGVWLSMPLIVRMMKDCRSLYPVAKYASINIPTYTMGQIGFVLCSKNKDTVFEEPVRTITEQEAEDMKLRYYDSQIHRASFVLPRFAKMQIDER